MQKEVKGKKKPVTTSSTKKTKTKTKFKIKKRVPEKKTSVNNKKNNEPKIRHYRYTYYPRHEGHWKPLLAYSNDWKRQNYLQEKER